MHQILVIIALMVSMGNPNPKHLVVRYGQLVKETDSVSTYETRDGNLWDTVGDVGINSKRNLAIVFDTMGTKCVEDDAIVAICDEAAGTITFE